MAVWWRARIGLGPFSSFAPSQGSTCSYLSAPMSNPNISHSIPLSMKIFFCQNVNSQFKVRYLLLGGAIGGGGALARQYDDWKNNLPDAAWLKKAMPDVDLDKFRTSLLSLKDTVKGKVGEVEMDPALKAAGWDKYQEFRGWFDKRLDSAIQAAIEEGKQEDDLSER